MSPADAGAVMRYADELADLRIIPTAAVTILQRLTFRYRPKRGRVACVGLDELAGDGMSKTTLIGMLNALERAFLIVKEKWGVVAGGRWRQMPNRYHLNTADEAKTAAIAAAEQRGEPEREYPLFTISLPPSESKSCTVLGGLDKDSTLTLLPTLYPREGQEEADNGRADVSTDEALSGVDPTGAARADGHVGGLAERVAVESGRSEAVSLGGALPDEHGQAHPDLPRSGQDHRAAVGQDPRDTRQARQGADRPVGGDGSRGLAAVQVSFTTASG
jgi:hypothetical protein